MFDTIKFFHSFLCLYTYEAVLREGAAEEDAGVRPKGCPATSTVGGAVVDIDLDLVRVITVYICVVTPP
jgi:hypothetical protein